MPAGKMLSMWNGQVPPVHKGGFSRPVGYPVPAEWCLFTTIIVLFKQVQTENRN